MSYPEAIELIDKMIRETEESIARVDALLSPEKSKEVE